MLWAVWQSIYLQTKTIKRLSINQTDYVTTLTSARLRRCRCHRPHHAARLAALARSWWRHSGNYYYGHQSVHIGPRSRYSCSTHILDWPLLRPYDLDFQSPASYDHDSHACKVSKSKMSWFKRESERTDTTYRITFADNAVSKYHDKLITNERLRGDRSHDGKMVNFTV